MEEFTIKSSSRSEIIDITQEVMDIVSSTFSSNARACLIDTGHTTRAIMVQENYDPDVNRDIVDFFGKLIQKEGWRHAEGNTDSHVKSLLVGSSKIVPIVNGSLALGRWQGISFCEFDGPRTRTIRITEI